MQGDGAMIDHFDNLGIGFFCRGVEATPDTCVNDFVWMSHLDTEFALAGSYLYGDCEAFV